MQVQWYVALMLVEVLSLIVSTATERYNRGHTNNQLRSFFGLRDEFILLFNH